MIDTQPLYPQLQRSWKATAFVVVGQIMIIAIMIFGFRDWIKASGLKFGSMVFGPEVKETERYPYYRFYSAKSFRGPSYTHRFSEWSREEFHGNLLMALPQELQNQAAPHLATILENAEQVQIDPLWVLAVIWTESHFDKDARSGVNARGLMQIMPGTGLYLAKLMEMDRSSKLTYELISDPQVNIEMGIFYLSKLLKMFRGNHRLATIAYNMGPNWVRLRLREGLPVGEKNKYWDKVNLNYGKLWREVHADLTSRPEPFHSTLAIDFKRRPNQLALWKGPYTLDFTQHPKSQSL